MALVHTSPWVITSPNVPFIPTFNFEPQPLCVRADGRLSYEDFTLHPQIWAEKYPWTPAILRKPLAQDIIQHPLRDVWSNITVGDYNLLRGSAFAELGTLHPSAVARFEQVTNRVCLRIIEAGSHHSLPPTVPHAVVCLRSVLGRLRDCPFSFKDLVDQLGEFRRIALNIIAMVDFYTHFQSKFADLLYTRPAVDETRMGAFTSDPAIAEILFRVGLPVWYLQEA